MRYSERNNNSRSSRRNRPQRLLAAIYRRRDDLANHIQNVLDPDAALRRAANLLAAGQSRIFRAATLSPSHSAKAQLNVSHDNTALEQSSPITSSTSRITCLNGRYFSKTDLSRNVESRPFLDLRREGRFCLSQELW